VFDQVSFAFDEHVVLRNVTFAVPVGSMTVLLGASGSGKSIILKLILGLLRPDAGHITVHGAPVDTMTEHDLIQVRADIGMLFQESALFDSLSVAGNVGYRLDEETDMPKDDVRRRVRRSWVSSALSRTSIRCLRNCRAASAAAWRSPERWRHGRICSCSTIRRPGSIRSRQ
jgi:ABC-type transporter Mla maintaining outer membrane lipid asymmetry ATPase subunit MlaF